jgi:hypothetical protein
MRRLSNKYPRLGSLETRPKIPASASYLPQQRHLPGWSIDGNTPVPPQSLEESLLARYMGSPPCPLEKPTGANLTTAQITIIPEVRSVAIEEPRSMWVAIEISGHVGPVNGMESAFGLDVVVVVDDS